MPENNNQNEQEYEREVTEQEFNMGLIRAMGKLKVKEKKLFCKILSYYSEIPQNSDNPATKFKVNKCDLIRFVWPKETGDRSDDNIPNRFYKMLDEMLAKISQLQIELPPKKQEEKEEEFPLFVDEFPNIAAQFPFLFGQIGDEDTEEDKEK